MKCNYCNTDLPDFGFFCPNCFKQIKCRHCNENLLKEAKICVYCGNEIGIKSVNSNINTIEFRETETERNFKASFTDTVGASVSESFGLFMAKKVELKKILPPPKDESFNSVFESNTEETIYDSNDNTYESDTENKEMIDIPTLTDVKLRDLAKNETDLFLVYIYFATDGGKKEFTREDIIKIYKEQGMYTPNRSKSLSQYFKNVAIALYIKSLNEKDFILLDKGKSKVFDIFKGNSEPSKRKAKPTSSGSSTEEKNKKDKKMKPKGNKVTNSIGFIDLNLTIEEQQKLTDFFNSKAPTTQNENVIVVMKWFKDYKNVEEISMEEMNYLLSLTSGTPPALPQVLGNMVGQKFRWVTKGAKGKYKLSSIGDNYVIKKLPKENK